MTSAVAWVLLFASLLPQLPGPSSLPPIDAQATFLYYADIDAATSFYQDVLRLRQTFDQGWVRIFAITPTSSVGIVDESRGAHAARDDNAVMLSLVTTDVDAWHTHLSGAGVEILSTPADSASVPVRAFLARDPGGYAVEFFQWID